MDKVLVIGASGLVGHKALDFGRSSNYDVYGTYNAHKIDGEKLFRLDIRKRDDVFALVEKLKPDFIIDAHTLAGMDFCELHPTEAWDINVNGTKNIAEAAKRCGAKFAYISTDMVFDGEKLEYMEKDKPNPLSYFAKTKLISELMLEPLDVNYVILRSALIYGKGGAGKTPWVAELISKLKSKTQVNALVDQSSNPTLADNLVEVMYKLLKDDAKGIFHTTGKDCMNRYDFSKLAAKIFGLDGTLIKPITAAELHQVAIRPVKIKMVTDKVERATGIKMLTSEEGLKKLKKQMEES